MQLAETDDVWAELWHSHIADIKHTFMDTVAGKQEEREVQLEETDEVWAELRHSHIADVYSTLSRKLNDFQAQNKAAQHQARGMLCVLTNCCLHAALSRMSMHCEFVIV